METILFITLLAFLFIGFLIGIFFELFYVNKNLNSISNNELKLREDMRNVWMDHMVDTRSVIQNVVNGKNTSEAIQLLTQNQIDIGSLLESYYGSGAGAQMSYLLLHGHVDIIYDLLLATKAGNTKAEENSDKLLQDNGNQIATLLNNLNPNWKKQDFINMWNNHLNLTEEEASAEFAKDTTGELLIYEQMRNQSLVMADWFSDGIVKQFPSSFNK